MSIHAQCRITTALMMLPGGAIAAESAPSISDVVVNLNTVWLMVAAALVFLMQAGFSLLEGGMARSKNAVNVIMKNYMDACAGGLGSRGLHAAAPGTKRHFPGSCFDQDSPGPHRSRA